MKIIETALKSIEIHYNNIIDITTAKNLNNEERETAIRFEREKIEEAKKIILKFSKS